MIVRKVSRDLKRKVNMFGKNSGTAASEPSSNAKHVKQVENALKIIEDFLQNNQITSVCCIKVY